MKTKIALTLTIEFDWITVAIEPARVVFIFRETWEELRLLWEKLPRQLVPGKAHEGSHWRKTFPMSNMFEEFYSERFFDKTYEDST